MWMTSATASSTASAQTIWQIYTEVATWSHWDRGTQQSAITGPFAVGTHGTLQSVGGPALPFEIIAAVIDQGFADRTFLGPDTTLIFRHVLTATKTATQITHIIEIDGPDADHLAVALGVQLTHGLREAVAGLATYATEREVTA